MQYTFVDESRILANGSTWNGDAMAFDWIVDAGKLHSTAKFYSHSTLADSILTDPRVASWRPHNAGRTEWSTRLASHARKRRNAHLVDQVYHVR